MSNLKQTFTTILILGTIFLINNFLFAWTAPTEAPPSGNVPAPINTSATEQYKSGAFGVGGVFRTYSDMVVDGALRLKEYTSDYSPVSTEGYGKLYMKEGTCEQQGNYFGDGSDGAVVISANTSLPVPNPNNAYDGDMVVKNYESLTINAGTTLTTAQPTRGLLIYVQGDLVVNGNISMTARGAWANPNGTASSDEAPVSDQGLVYPVYKSTEGVITNQVIRFSGTGVGAVNATNNQGINGVLDGINGKVFTLQKTGAAGSTRGTWWCVGGCHGSSGAVGQTGGGGGGGSGDGWGAGNGSAGTVFSGGSGGGGHYSCGGSGCGYDASAYGGKGGNGGGTDHVNCGGAGNPVGTHVGAVCNTVPGTGGLLILIVGGNITVGSSGSIQSNGSYGGTYSASYIGGGGGSGGGNILVLYGGSITGEDKIYVNGGNGGSGCSWCEGGMGGNGGAGSKQYSKIDAPVACIPGSPVLYYKNSQGQEFNLSN